MRRAPVAARLLGLGSHAPRAGLAYLAVHVLVYVLALAAMVLIFGTKQRGLVIGPAVGLVGAAGSWYLLGDTPVDARRRATLTAGVGVLMAELTWALGYWNVAALAGGAILWLGFYTLSGIVEHAASQRLDRRVALEYAVVWLVGALLIVGITRPWSL